MYWRTVTVFKMAAVADSSKALKRLVREAKALDETEDKPFTYTQDSPLQWTFRLKGPVMSK